jgi:hypothetical protein
MFELLRRNRHGNVLHCHYPGRHLHRKFSESNYMIVAGIAAISLAALTKALARGTSKYDIRLPTAQGHEIISAR